MSICFCLRPGPLWRTLLACAALSSALHAQPFIAQEVRIPMAAAGPKGLQALIIRPNEPGRHPLVLVNHGSPANAADPPKMHPYQEWLPALEFVRRGWVAAIVMRRGYGQSGGERAERIVCDHANYLIGAKASVEDLRAAIDYLTRLPEVDPRRILSVGVSAGGFALTVASRLQAFPIRDMFARPGEVTGQLCIRLHRIE